MMGFKIDEGLSRRFHASTHIRLYFASKDWRLDVIHATRRRLVFLLAVRIPVEPLSPRKTLTFPDGRTLTKAGLSAKTN